MKYLLVFFLITVSVPAFAQIGIGTTTPNSSSVLDLSSTQKGILIPRMTTFQKNHITAPAAGLLVYQTDSTSGFYYYSGSVWQRIAPAGVTP